MQNCIEVRFNMRFYIFLFIGLTTLCCSNNKSDNKEFIEFLGTEKAIALNELMLSFDSFIENNYGKVNDKNIRDFLKDFSCENSLKPNLIFEKEKNERILEEFEKTGLRRDIWLYGSETDYKEYPILELINQTVQTDSLESLELKIEDEIIPITKDKSINYDSLEKSMKLQWDTTLSTNQRGAFLFGLYKFSNDSLIKEYVELKTSFGDIGVCTIKKGILNLKNDLSLFYLKLIITVEIYYPLIKKTS